MLAIDPVSWAITPLTVTSGAGATGICRLGDDVFVANQTAEPSVAVLDARTLCVRGKAHFARARDVHSLAVWQGRIAVASTGTDEVLWYRSDGGELVDRTVLAQYETAVVAQRDELVHLAAVDLRVNPRRCAWVTRNRYAVLVNAADPT